MSSNSGLVRRYSKFSTLHNAEPTPGPVEPSKNDAASVRAGSAAAPGESRFKRRATDKPRDRSHLGAYFLLITAAVAYIVIVKWVWL